MFIQLYIELKISGSQHFIITIFVTTPPSRKEKK